MNATKDPEEKKSDEPAAKKAKVEAEETTIVQKVLSCVFTCTHIIIIKKKAFKLVARAEAFFP